jgi:NAD(P)-dependent dehydrogenase (short-subunit alcohol dehydrogenase family)
LGATGALGGEIARRLLGLSSTVFVHGDNQDELALLHAGLSEMDDQCRVVPITSDFASLRATRDLVRQCTRGCDEVDLVVNAVDMLPPHSRTLTEDGNEVTWQVNYLGPALIALGLVPLLRNSSGSRIIHVIGDQHRVGVPRAAEPGAGKRYYPAWSYAESKLALMMLNQTMARRLRGSGCRSITLQPAGVEVGGVQAPLSRALTVDAVLYACTSVTMPNGAYLRGRRIHPLPRAAAGLAVQQRMWRTTCRALALDARTGWPIGPWDDDTPGRPTKPKHDVPTRA